MPQARPRLGSKIDSASGARIERIFFSGLIDILGFAISELSQKRLVGLSRVRLTNGKRRFYSRAFAKVRRVRGVHSAYALPLRF